MCRAGACVNDSSAFLGAERQDSLADCVKTCKDNCEFVSFCPKEKPFCNTTKVNLCARYSSCKNSTESSNPGYPLHIPLVIHPLVLHCASLCFAVLRCASLCFALLRSASQCFTVLHCASLFCTVLYCGSLCFTVFGCTSLCFTVLRCALLELH